MPASTPEAVEIAWALVPVSPNVRSLKSDVVSGVAGRVAVPSPSSFKVSVLCSIRLRVSWISS